MDVSQIICALEKFRKILIERSKKLSQICNFVEKKLYIL